MFTALNLGSHGANPETFTDDEKLRFLGQAPAQQAVKSLVKYASSKPVMTVFSVVESSNVYDEYESNLGLYATEQAARRVCDEAVGDYLRQNSDAHLVESEYNDYKIVDGGRCEYFDIFEVPVMQ